MTSIILTMIFWWLKADKIWSSMVVFCSITIPPLLLRPDALGAFAAGFVNPYTSGYSAVVAAWWRSEMPACWVILAAWIAQGAETLGIKHG